MPPHPGPLTRERGRGGWEREDESAAAPPRYGQRKVSQMKQPITAGPMRILASLAIALTLGLAAPALAAPHEATLPLHDGKIELSAVSARLVKELHLSLLHLPALKGEIDLNSAGGWNFIQAVDGAFGDACRVTVEPPIAWSSISIATSC